MSPTAESGAQWRLGWRPGLDGLRGMAIVLVLLNHAGLPFTGTAGSVGVNVFFVLSGFLITRLLLEERQGHGSISLRQFWARRSLRLFPAMYANLAVTAVVAVLYDQPLSHILYAGTYVMNIVRAAGERVTLNPHTWSLAAEEQFYLVWPVVFAVALVVGRGSRRASIWLAAGGVTLSMVARTYLARGDAPLLRLHNGPELSAGVLLAGCLLALLVERTPGAWSRRAWPAMAGFVVILWASTGHKSTSFYGVWLPLVVLVSTGVIAYLVQDEQSPTVVRLTTWPPLVYLGRISYGLYLWHYTANFVVKHHVAGPVSRPLARIVSGLALGILSYHLLERPFLERKDRIRRAGASQQSEAATLQDDEEQHRGTVHRGRAGRVRAPAVRDRRDVGQPRGGARARPADR